MFHVASRFDPDGQIHEFVDLTTPADKEPFIFAKLPLKLYEKSVPPTPIPCFTTGYWNFVRWSR